MPTISQWLQKDEFYAAGTSEGAVKGWDTRGRTGRQNVQDAAESHGFNLSERSGSSTEYEHTEGNLHLNHDHRTGAWELGKLDDPSASLAKGNNMSSLSRALEKHAGPDIDQERDQDREEEDA